MATKKAKVEVVAGSNDDFYKDINFVNTLNNLFVNKVITKDEFRAELKRINTFKTVVIDRSV